MRLTGKKEIPYGGFANETKVSFVQRLAKMVRGNFFIPDPRKGWNRYAYRKAVELIREHGIDTVVTTSPPHSTQLIGLKLKQKLGIRWIADLRDPWTDIYYYSELYHSFFARHVDRRLELKVLQQADRIITVSQDVKRIFAEKLSASEAGKFAVIPNGYDEEDFQQEIQPDTDRFVITYTGTISAMYDIDGFLAALSALPASQLATIKLRFVGKIPPSIVEKIRQAVPDLELELVGYVDHHRSVGYLLQSSMQLLVIPKVDNNKGIITGKFFEYLASGKPVLAIGPKGGNLDDLMQETGCGQLFGFDDYQGMKSMISQCQDSSLETGEQQRAQYSRRELTRQLVDKHILPL